MGRLLTVGLVVATMVVLIVPIDILVFRDHPWPRLAANIGIVLLVGAFYFRFRSQL